MKNTVVLMHGNETTLARGGSGMPFGSKHPHRHLYAEVEDQILRGRQKAYICIVNTFFMMTDNSSACVCSCLFVQLCV
jgi:hypothetical protein